jgi:hypothetical protein
MAVVAKSTRASMDATTGMIAPQISGLIAGEASTGPAFWYIKAADGKAYLTDATALDEKARVAGFCPRAVNAGEPLTLFSAGTCFKYSDALLTPGALYFIDVTANKGGLNTAATIGDPNGKVQAVTTSMARLVALV